MLGVAVSTAVPAVGSTCPHIVPGVGAASTQAWVNPYLAIESLNRLRSGADAPTALAEALRADDSRELRQIGLVDAAGGAASWSGPACTPWFGDLTGEGWAIQGNMLTGPEVLDAMRDAFLGAETPRLPNVWFWRWNPGKPPGATSAASNPPRCRSTGLRTIRPSISASMSIHTR